MGSNSADTFGLQGKIREDSIVATPTFSREARKALAVTSLILDGIALSMPDPYSKFAIGLATGLNAASLYLLKEEPK